MIHQIKNELPSDRYNEALERYNKIRQMKI
jgi:hypothetical protein